MPSQKQARAGMGSLSAPSRFSLSFFKLMKKRTDEKGERRSGFLIDQVEEERAEDDGLSAAEKEMQERIMLQQQGEPEGGGPCDQMVVFREMIEKRKQLLNQDRLLSVFGRELPDLRKEQIVDMLLNEDGTLTATAERIFTRSIEDYLVIQTCCRRKNIARFLLNNKIEQLIGHARSKNFRDVQHMLQTELAHGNILLCFKMLFLLHRLNQHSSKRPDQGSKRQAAIADMEGRLLQMRLDGGKKLELDDRGDREAIVDFFIELYIDQVLRLRRNRLQLLETRDEIKNIFKQRLLLNTWTSFGRRRRAVEGPDVGDKDIQYLAKELGAAIVIHDHVDIYKFKMYGHNQILKNKPSLHFRKYGLAAGQRLHRLQAPPPACQYQHVELKSCPIIHDLQRRDFGKMPANPFFEKIIKEMPKWFQYFHDIKSIFRIILSPDQSGVDLAKVQFLESFADDFHAWQLKPSKQRFTTVVHQCEKLAQIDSNLLQEWSEKFKRTSKSIYTPEQIIKYLTFNSTRDDQESCKEMKKQLKEFYPDMTCMQTLVDFQRVRERASAQIGINTNCERDVLQYIQGMPFTYASNLLQ